MHQFDLLGESMYAFDTRTSPQARRRDVRTDR